VSSSSIYCRWHTVESQYCVMQLIEENFCTIGNNVLLSRSLIQTIKFDILPGSQYVLGIAYSFLSYGSRYISIGADSGMLAVPLWDCPTLRPSHFGLRRFLWQKTSFLPSECFKRHSITVHEKWFVMRGARQWQTYPIDGRDSVYAGLDGRHGGAGGCRPANSAQLSTLVHVTEH